MKFKVKKEILLESLNNTARAISTKKFNTNINRYKV